MPQRLFKKYLTAVKQRPAYIIINTLSALTCGIALIVGGIALNKASNQADRAKTLAEDTRKLAIRIQNQRVNITYKNCRDQNDRHRAGIHALKALLFKSGVNPKRKAAYTQTKPFVDAIVPFRNCVKVANSVIPKPIPKERKNDNTKS